MMNDVFQIAYVTNDMSFAADMFRKYCGIESWRCYNGVKQAVGDGYMINDAAVAFAGKTQIEIIRPAGGDDGFYRDLLPTDGPAVRFHHHGYLCSDEAHMRHIEDRLVALGVTIPLSGQYGDSLRYLYADTRKTLGHYLEYIRINAEAGDFFGDVPRY